jgi:hypothetical protein
MVDPEIADPLRGEAQAQDEATVMPWVWGGFGILAIAIFVAAIIFSGGHHAREPAGAAPVSKPMSQG